MEAESVKVDSYSELEFNKADKRYLGEGSSGRVCLVRHKRLNRYFALKEVGLEQGLEQHRLTPDKKVDQANVARLHKERDKAAQAAHTPQRHPSLRLFQDETEHLPPDGTSRTGKSVHPSADTREVTGRDRSEVLPRHLSRSSLSALKERDPP